LPARPSNDFRKKTVKKPFFLEKIYFPANFAEVLLLGTQHLLAVVIRETNPNYNN
jgi:hypothetical protein